MVALFSDVHRRLGIYERVIRAGGKIDDVYKINSGVITDHRTLTMLISSRSRVMVQVRQIGEG